MREHTFTIRFLAPGRTLDDLSIDLYDRIDDASLEGPDHDGSFLYEFDRVALAFRRARDGAERTD